MHRPSGSTRGLLTMLVAGLLVRGSMVSTVPRETLDAASEHAGKARRTAYRRHRPGIPRTNAARARRPMARK